MDELEGLLRDSQGAVAAEAEAEAIREGRVLQVGVVRVALQLGWGD